MPEEVVSQEEEVVVEGCTVVCPLVRRSVEIG